MNAWMDRASTFYDQYQVVVIVAGVVLGIGLLSLIAAQVWAGYRGRSLSARASLGFAVVQAGVAYVTITGTFEFWHRLVGMPWGEAALIAAMIEAVTWASVGMVFAHGAEPGSTGPGPAAIPFWMSIVGGGLMAVVGSPSLAVASGRAVVVAIGASMWHLRIRQKTRPAVERKRTRFTVTPRQLMIRAGWLIADDDDLVQTPREWAVRQLARAIRRHADGSGLTKWMGGRTIVRVMESGDAAMVREAQARYALAVVLRDDMTPGSLSMVKAIDAARADLYPPKPDPAPPVEQVPAPQQSRPPAPPVRRTPQRPPARTAAAARARTDPSAAARKAEAIEVAVSALTSTPPMPLTGKELGTRFGFGEEWGRQRLIDAQGRLAAHNGVQPVA